MHTKRNRTPSKYIGYGLYLYFLYLSYKNTSKALSQFIKRSHVAIWKWIQSYKPKKIARKRKRIFEFILDETLVMIGYTYMWIWVAMEPESKHILAVTVSKERTMLIAERFILSLTNRYGIHPVSTEMVDVVSTTSL